MGVTPGAVARLSGNRDTHVRIVPGTVTPGQVAVDAFVLRNSQSAEGQQISLDPVKLRPLDSVVIRTETPELQHPGDLSDALFDMTLTEGDRFLVPLPQGAPIEIEVVSAAPEAAGLFGAESVVSLESQPSASPEYEGIGGLEEQITRVHEMIAAPLVRPELYERLGIAAPRGVLFCGPPGSGKTLLARAVAARTHAAFFHINGPEIVSKHYGDSEAALRGVFDAASARAPSIIFIDEIDAIAPRRDALSGEKQVERRVVAQLLTLLDGLADRGRVVVMAATNLPDSLDPALRRPGRFDREIVFKPPSVQERREILAVHLARAPLGQSADLDALAEETHGYVGADLAALAREAAVAALARSVAESGGEDRVKIDTLEITGTDLSHGLRATAPSALRGAEALSPPTHWEDLGGASAVREALDRAVLWPRAHGSAFRALGLTPARGVLLVGPPGTGKTLAGRVLATESGMNFLPVRAPRLLSQYFGEAERAVAELFATARAAAPTLLFFDELDALAPRRTGKDPVLDRIVAQLLTEFDGLADVSDVVVLAATNRPASIDPALTRPGRFDTVVDFPLPNAEARNEILEIHLRGRSLAADLSTGSIAQASNGMTGADLRVLVEEAAREALCRAVHAGLDQPQISSVDLERALARMREGSALREDDHILARQEIA